MGHPVVVLSYDYWESRFARDPKVVGKKILVNNYPMTIVGVSAAGFSGVDPATSPAIRVPILMKEAMLPEWTWVHVQERRTRWVQVFARLKPGYTVQTAQPPMQTLFTQIRQYEMTLPAAKDWSKYSREQFMKGQLIVEKADIGYSGLRNDFSTALVVLMCMVGLVLLIACANVANLLIARGFMRQREIAVRLSLGASRGRLVRQLLVESLVLSFVGGAVGVAVAVGLTDVLLAFVPTEGRPLLIHATPDLRILGFTFLLTLVTGVVFGLIPALRASRPDPWTTLKDTMGSIAGAGGSLFLRKGLVAAQVALSFLLLFGAGLFVRSLHNLKGTDTGVELDNLVTFQLSPAYGGYSVERAAIFNQQLVDRLRASAGVKSAGYSAVSILSGDEWDSSTSVEGHKAADGEDMQAFMNAVSPGYFEAMKIPLLEGRDFTRSDETPWTTTTPGASASSTRSSPITSSMARAPSGATWARASGRTRSSTSRSSASSPMRSTKVRARACTARCSCRTTATRASPTTCAGKMASSAIYSLIRNEVRGLDSGMPVYAMKSVESQLDETLLSDRLVALLSAGFGLLATVLASVGLYGVMAFVVARRRKELGIRLALGAQRTDVIWMVMKEVLLLLAIGLVDRDSHSARGRPVRLRSALRNPAVRSDDCHRDAGAPDGGLRAGRVDSRASRKPDRPDHGAAVRVTDYGLRDDRRRKAHARLPR